MNSQSFSKILILVIFLALMVGIIGGVLVWRQGGISRLDFFTATRTSSTGWRYELEDIPQLISEYGPTLDQRIVRIDTKTNKKEVLVDSVQKAFGLPRKVEFGETLYKVSFPSDSLKLYLAHVNRPGEGMYPLALVSFDINKKEFSKMAVSKYFVEAGRCIWIEEKRDEAFCMPTGGALSPNGKMLVVAPVDELNDRTGLSQTLWLLDLEKDEARVLVKLSGSETFNASARIGYPTGKFDIKWVDNEKIEYSTYDQSVPPQLDSASEMLLVGRFKPLVAKRTINKSEAVQEEIVGWNIYRTDDFEFRYPDKLDTQYINIYSFPWPPKISFKSIDPNFICVNNPNLKTALGYGWSKKIGNYCVTMGSEGAAGSSYRHYKYQLDKDNKQIILEFTLVYPNCGVYDLDIVNKCEEEERNFDPNVLVDQIISTFIFFK